MASLQVRCFAKINTVLLVLGKRDDGFHELDTEFVSLALHDTLDLETAGEGFSLELLGATEDEVPVADNLVLRAARRLQEALGEEVLPGARLRLEKRTPAAAGLGGGSSDAAGALLGLCRLHELSPPEGLLAELALELGSDVPYFLVGGRCRGRGRGERLEALPDRPDRAVALLVSRDRLGTASVFQAHSRSRGALGKHSAHALTRRKIGPSVLDEPWWQAPDYRLRNDLRPSALKLSTRLAEVEARLRAVAPAQRVGMTGSGPTLFALLEPGEDVSGIEDRRSQLERGDADLILTRTLGRAELERTRFGAPPGAPSE
jgi:4-diphosphocytidyl-2-C-methyl-D-erythritol kinase